MNPLLQPIENIRLETRWNDLGHGHFELLVLEDSPRRVVLFYHIGTAEHPEHRIHYGVRLQDQQGESILWEGESLQLEQALQEFERLYPTLQNRASEVLEQRRLTV